MVNAFCSCICKASHSPLTSCHGCCHPDECMHADFQLVQGRIGRYTYKGNAVGPRRVWLADR